MPGSFAQYINDCAQTIHKARSQFYQGEKLEQVTRMSLPFELKPSNPQTDQQASKYKKGILLTHGFLSSPYLMKSLGEDFAKAGFLVRAVLLPGHGTFYQDLDNYTWEDYLATVRFGFETLVQDCEEVYLCGFSIGATLSLLIALEELKQPKTSLKKLVLLAPCFGISPFATSFPWLVKTKLSKFLPQLFCTQAEKEHLGSYTQFSLKSVSEIVRMLKTLKIQLAKYHQKKLPLPIYVLASHEDATVKFAPILNFVNTYLNKDSYVRIYSNQALPAIDIPNTIIPAKGFNNIIAISHVAMPVASTDAYFGINGSYYGALPPNTRFGEPQYTHKVKRLTYNPEYTTLRDQLISWTNENDSHLHE